MAKFAADCLCLMRQQTEKPRISAVSAGNFTNFPHIAHGETQAPCCRVKQAFVL
jgi:hypothetical protein